MLCYRSYVHPLQICILGKIFSVISLHGKRGCDPVLFHREVHCNWSGLRDNHKGFPIVMLNNSSVLWDLFKVSFRQEILPGKFTWRPYFGCSLRGGGLKSNFFLLSSLFRNFLHILEQKPKSLNISKGINNTKQSHKLSHP